MPRLGGDRRPQRRHCTLRQSRHCEHGIDERVVRGRLAEHVEPAADLRVLQCTQVAIDVQDDIVEVIARRRRLVEREVAVDLCVDEQLPHLVAQRGKLGRIHRRHLRIGVEELLELREVVVEVGARQRRGQMVDDDRVGSPLGLRAFAGIVDDEGIEHRHLAQREVGIARVRQRERLAGEPFQRAVLAEMDDGGGAPTSLCQRQCEPLVEGQIVMRRWEIGRVIRADRIRAEPSRRLDGDQHAAQVDAGKVELAVVRVDLARRRSPYRLDTGACRLGQRREPLHVPIRRQTNPRRMCAAIV